MNTGLKYLTIVAVILMMAGFTTIKKVLVIEKTPTIAHVHIGHAITGWKHSPGQKDLFQVAEEEADIAPAHAGYAIEQPDMRVEILFLHRDNP